MKFEQDTAPIVEAVKTYILEHQLLPEQGTVVVAVSGGTDSVCLLHILSRLCGPGRAFAAVRLHVAHLNHQLRGSASERDAAVVAQLAASLELPFTLGSEDVQALARRERRSLEDAARAARYRFLRSVVPGSRIAVAHHLDDQVETLLLHWLRGGGITAMLGLQPVQHDIIRPLLTLDRATTLAYCAQHQLDTVEDESNSDIRFLRNRIRHELLPLLESINPGFRATLLRTSEVMQVDAAWIDAQINACWDSVVLSSSADEIQLRRAALLALPLSLQRHLLRRVTARLCGGQSPLELRHYKLIEQLLAQETGEEHSFHLPERIRLMRNGELVRFFLVPVLQTGVEVEPLPVALSVPGTRLLSGMHWKASAELVPVELTELVRDAVRRKDWSTVWRLLPSDRYTVYIDGACARDGLWIRRRQPGDRMQPLGMNHEKKVQDILVDRHIPRFERDSIPLFFNQSHCVWLAGIGIDHRARLTAETRQIVRLSLVYFDSTQQMPVLSENRK
ncbi:tRNA(Ile)-lysidine synthase [Thermosporothrix hazakensis]|jgi:tRNA(Ile)-lysidine synthase|uniref:tRNA(Ile)-lysidine synthase n=2 Tax=Thermosporothrix TaxID=768650 RepID=A0A326U1E2_THEHA|nr:tRNA lysidine(34) synthetase TilS [Thermosporothrix hazakensis]PZW23441.1 tRNA(Ile)-lysidine synthase [Thermosporothrix hazakensis]BBH89787.1 tRNA(Ile)-lysidine synthase [Thermosporothrix sp. COM3]GCE47976.1 tRNA(Ile)-lysidine synthase [Thermosporothrix hazakensis]